MKQIPLSRGQVAMVDDEDYEWLCQWKWSAFWSPSARSFYAHRCSSRREGKTHSIYMHREILGLKHGDSRIGDHVDPEQTLDNRRSNLRIATRTENRRNSVKQRDNTSGFKGVSFHKRIGKYQAQLNINGVRKSLGYRTTPEEAHVLYREAVKLHHGEYARV